MNSENNLARALKSGLQVDDFGRIKTPIIIFLSLLLGLKSLVLTVIGLVPSKLQVMFPQDLTSIAVSPYEIFLSPFFLVPAFCVLKGPKGIHRLLWNSNRPLLIFGCLLISLHKGINIVTPHNNGEVAIILCVTYAYTGYLLFKSAAVTFYFSDDYRNFFRE